MEINGVQTEGAVSYAALGLSPEIMRALDNVVIASDDGSIGIKGTVLDAMEDVYKRQGMYRSVQVSMG